MAREPRHPDPLAVYVTATRRAELLALLAGALELAAELGFAVDQATPDALDRDAAALDLNTLALDAADMLAADTRDVLAVGETARGLARAIARRDPARARVLRDQLDRELAGLRAESAR